MKRSTTSEKKKFTLTQESPVIFVAESSQLAYKEASEYVSEQNEKGIARGYSVAYAVIITPIRVDCESLTTKTRNQ